MGIKNRIKEATVLVVSFSMVLSLALSTTLRGEDSNITNTTTSTVTSTNTNTNNNTVQTKESVKALIQSDAITKGADAFQNQANNTGSTLTGFFLADYFVNSDGMVHLLCSMQDGNNMVVGDVLCTLPVGYRPAASGSHGYVPVFTAVNSTSNPTITSQWMVKTNGDITCISVSGGSNQFYGQCIFSAFNPN